MIQFLYQSGFKSHDKRAEALAALTGSPCDDIGEKEPCAVGGLDTLALWGHGDPYAACGKDPKELAALLKAWKKANPGLTTVELITCNARHSKAGSNPFVASLKSELGMFSSLIIKALPVSVAGQMNVWSILLAELDHSSWVYITAQGIDDKLLMKVKTLIDCRVNENGGLSSFKGDMAERADKVIRDKVDPDPEPDPGGTRRWTMNYGYLPTLRASLGVVR